MSVARVPISRFAARVGLSPRHVHRLVPLGLPAKEGRVDVAAGRRWLREHRRSLAAQARAKIAEQLALLHARTAACAQRAARISAVWCDATKVERAFKAVTATVLRVVRRWQSTAPTQLAAILAPGGPRLIPGHDARAIGYAVQEYCSRPLLAAIAAALEVRPTSRRRRIRPDGRGSRGQTLGEARAQLAAARTAELELRTLISANPRWRLRTEINRELEQRVASSRSEIWTALPGALARRATGQPPTMAELTATAARRVRTVEEILTGASPAGARPLPPSHRPRAARRRPRPPRASSPIPTVEDQAP